MLPYLIAGAIGFGIAKLFEEGGETFGRGGKAEKKYYWIKMDRSKIDEYIDYASRMMGMFEGEIYTQAPNKVAFDTENDMFAFTSMIDNHNNDNDFQEGDEGYIYYEELFNGEPRPNMFDKIIGNKYDNGGGVNKMMKYDTLVHYVTSNLDKGEKEYLGINAFSKEDAEKKAKIMFNQEDADRYDATIEYVSVWERGEAYKKGGSMYADGGLAKKRRRRANAQIGKTDRSVDKTRVAKPVGYRFTNSLASKLRKDQYAVPTEKQITKYLGKGIYKENRRNKSDRDRTAKL